VPATYYSKQQEIIAASVMTHKFGNASQHLSKRCTIFLRKQVNNELHAQRLTSWLIENSWVVTGSLTIRGGSFPIRELSVLTSQPAEQLWTTH